MASFYHENISFIFFQTHFQDLKLAQIMIIFQYQHVWILEKR